MKKVFIGVGHGGKDPGAVCGDLKEKNINLGIALEVDRILKQNGVKSLLSRTSDIDNTVEDEVRQENEFNSDLCLDIHTNAGGGDGFEIYYHHLGEKGLSKKLALNIEQEVLAIGQNSRGLKVKLNNQGEDYFMFIRKTKGSSVLIECAFIDTSDINIINTEEKQKVFGNAIAKGVLKTLGIRIESKYVVVTGSFKNYDNAKSELTKILNNYKDAFIYKNGEFYRVCLKEFNNEIEASNLSKKLLLNNLDNFIAIK